MLAIGGCPEDTSSNSFFEGGACLLSYAIDPVNQVSLTHTPVPELDGVSKVLSCSCTTMCPWKTYSLPPSCPPPPLTILTPSLSTAGELPFHERE